MLYDENQEFGGGGPDDEMKKKKAKQPGAPATTGQPGQAAAAPQMPQTFAEKQKMGLARPPMPSIQTPRLDPRINPIPSAPPARLDPRINPMVPPQGAAQPGGQVLTKRAVPGGINPWTGERVPGGEGVQMAPGGSIITSTAPNAPGAGAPPAGTPNFDPMEWFRQQVLGGSQNVLERSKAYLGGQIDDDYDVREQRLREEMASRGLGDSTVYGGRMQDLNVGRRSAQEGLGERLALEDLQRQQGMVDRMVGMDAESRNYLLQLLGFGYGG
jgi:hypothetical protein